MNNVFLFNRTPDLELNQEIESLEEKMARVRRFKDLSPRQRRTYIEANQWNPKLALEEIIGEAASMHRQICDRYY